MVDMSQCNIIVCGAERRKLNIIDRAERVILHAAVSRQVAPKHRQMRRQHSWQPIGIHFTHSLLQALKKRLLAVAVGWREIVGIDIGHCGYIAFARHGDDMC